MTEDKNEFVGTTAFRRFKQNDRITVRFTTEEGETRTEIYWVYWDGGRCPRCNDGSTLILVGVYKDGRVRGTSSQCEKWLLEHVVEAVEDEPVDVNVLMQTVNATVQRHDLKVYEQTGEMSEIMRASLEDALKQQVEEALIIGGKP